MFKEKMKSLINTEKETNNKKKIENLVVFVIILIIVIVAINSIWSDSKALNKNKNITDKNLASTTSSEPNLQDNTYNNTNLEKSLEDILSTMNGVGKVKVFINYSESSMVEAMYNETTKESSTEETDTTGGVRTIQQTDTQKDVIYSEDGGNKTPVTQKITNPTVEGAIITAQGANDSNVKSNIINAVSAATGLSAHKIQVFKMSN